MDIDAATGTVSDCETCVDTVENVACMETDKTVTDTTPDATHSFHKAGPEVSAQYIKKVKFVNLNVECINSKQYDISFITDLANFDCICLTETFAESTVPLPYGIKIFSVLSLRPKSCRKEEGNFR